ACLSRSRSGECILGRKEKAAVLTARMGGRGRTRIIRARRAGPQPRRAQANDVGLRGHRPLHQATGARSFAHSQPLSRNQRILLERQGGPSFARGAQPSLRGRAHRALGPEPKGEPGTALHLGLSRQGGNRRDRIGGASGI
ncbi:uncharacterized protein METZ01_LOCUS516501, partial [marine metagenome]